MSKHLSKIGGIRGHGGGGGKGGGGDARVPVEAPDSLRSRQYARVLDLLCEGEIEGLVDGLKSVYLEDTPIQNDNDSYNFKGVTFSSRNGTQDQELIPGFSSVESEKPVGIEVKKDIPIVRTVSNENLDAVRVTISIPQLTLQDTTNGDLNGSSLQIAIDIQENGGGFIPQPLRAIWSSEKFSVTSPTTARGYVESERYTVNVGWSGQPNVYSPQTCTFNFQYRKVGDSTWITHETYKFSGNATVKPVIPNYNNGISGLNDFTNVTQYVAASGSKKFSLTLPKDMYEFRVNKLTGSSSAGKGGSFGGTVKIKSGQLVSYLNYDTITGKTTTRYQRDYRVSLPGSGPWDIRVRRLTADSTQAVLQNKTFWDSYTEITDVKLNYPNSALAGLQVSAEQFTAIPRRGYLIKGLKVRIPSNYDPLERTYEGAWDGTFVIAWTDNPAWCLYDMITTGRYGLGEYIDQQLVDKWILYNIGQYCDELIDDGYGGIEPRFTLNLYLQTREDAYQVISNVAAVFRSMSYWSAGTQTTVQDAPSDPVALFTCANVINGTFNYIGSSRKARHTVVLVSWNNPLNFYKQEVEYVEDVDGIARYGIIKSEVVALGCTSRGQAHRLGKAILYTELSETETVVFRAGLDGTVCYPGATIKVQDQFRSGERFGGRIKVTGTDQIELDAPVTLLINNIYTLSCVMPDGTIEDRIVITPAGEVSVLELEEPFSVEPLPYAIWILTTPSLQPTMWRIISVAEVEKTQIEVVALSYNPNKYDAIEKDLILETPNYSNIGTSPDPCTNLTIIESLTLVGLNLVGVKATVSWDTNPTAIRYVVSYNKEEGNIVQIETANNTIEISPLDDGNYSFSVVAVNSIGRKSQPVSKDITIYGKTIPPTDVENFTVIKVTGEARVNWTLHPDLDVQVGGVIVIRHSPILVDATWQDGIIYEAFPGNSINGVLPLTTGTYMAKARDSSGNWSENMVSFIATEGMVTGWTTVGFIQEDPDFLGDKVGLASLAGEIKLSGSKNIGEMLTPVSQWAKLSSLGGINSEGTYEFHDVLDLSTVETRRFESNIVAQSFDTEDLISKRGLVSQWGNVTGAEINDCDATLFVSTTEDDPEVSPVWTDYAPFFVGDFTCRAAKFYLYLESENPTHNIRVSELSVTAKIPA